MPININDPSLSEVVSNLRLSIFTYLNCVKVGKIISFDGARKTAKVQLLFKRQFDDDRIVSYSPLVDVPVFTLQGGGGALQFPISAGDNCIVLFSDRNLDTWFQTGSEAIPPNSRFHDLSDGIALVGLNALTSALAVYDDNVNLILPTGKKLVVSNGTAAEILGNLMLALKTDVDNIMTYLGSLVLAFNLHVHTSAAPGNPTSVPNVPFITTPPVMVGTTKLKGS